MLSKKMLVQREAPTCRTPPASTRAHASAPLLPPHSFLHLNRSPETSSSWLRKWAVAATTTTPPWPTRRSSLIALVVPPPSSHPTSPFPPRDQAFRWPPSCFPSVATLISSAGATLIATPSQPVSDPNLESLDPSRMGSGWRVGGSVMLDDVERTGAAGHGLPSRVLGSVLASAGSTTR